MKKIRVYELARELQMESRDLVTKIKAMGILVSSYRSALSEAQCEKIKDALAPKPKTPKHTVIRRRKKAQPEASDETQAAPSTGEKPSSDATPEESQDDTAATPAAAAQAEESAAAPPSVTQKPTSTLSRMAQKLAHERSLAKAKEKPDEPFKPARTVRKADPKEPAPQDLAAVEKKLTTQARGPHPRSRKDEPSHQGELVRPRPVAKKERRSQISARDLLSRLDQDDQDVTPSRKKTIYAPTGGRGRDPRRRKDLKKTPITTPKASLRVVQMPSTSLSVGELARQLSMKSAELIKYLMKEGVMATVNEHLDSDTIELVANNFGFKVQAAYKTVDEILARSTPSAESFYHRPPIVTLMGHVDHGKTSILDALRESAVSADEAGGITQHIGAYQVHRQDKVITFLDTPGHAAFSSIRSRGARVTDMVVLVVAADDGVMPQTKEAISHAQNAEVPVIVALNKIDKPGGQLDRIYSELAEQGIQSEEWGGEHQFVKMSALQRTGIEELLEAILLQAELMELKSSKEVEAQGVIIEAHKDIGRGVVATVMVGEGVFRTGDRVVAGTAMGRIRMMMNDQGQEIAAAPPSAPAQIVGFADLPAVGDRVDAVKDQETARAVVARRKEEAAASAQKTSTIATLEELIQKVDEEKILAFPFIIKADTQGSLQAITEALQDIQSEKIKAKIVHGGVGAINASDIALAAASKSVIFGFHVRAIGNLAEEAEEEGVVINYFGVIYELIDAAKSLMAGSLPAITNEITIGHADVKQPISIPKVGLIAGASVVDGHITRGCGVRLIRDSVVIHSSKVASLRRFKNDVKEVNSGYECGIGIENCRDIREGDVIEAFELEEVQDTL